MEEHIVELTNLAASDPTAAREYLTDVFGPFMEQELQPNIHAYLGQSEEELGDQLRLIESRTATTTRVALTTSAIAALVALLLAFIVWRSIHNPLVKLHAAAIRLGHGHLDTRVAISSKDELGDLAGAFNRMAADLSSSTLSISNLENIFGSMTGALILLTPEGRMMNMNRAVLSLLGYERNDLIGRSFELICPREDGDSPLPTEGDETGHRVSERSFRRRDGTTVPVSFSAADLRHAEGTMQGYVCVAQDLTEQKRIEAQVRNSLAEKELLLREVHHRVKSNMQVISSMLAMQSSCSSDPHVIDGLEQSQTRIRSMALIHEHLYQSSDLAHIDVRVYLDILTRHLERSYGMSATTELQLRLEDLDLDLDRSLSCGLIVNELVVNAYRHAFGENCTGMIRVELTRQAGDLVELRVSDDGRGLTSPFRPDRATTLGLNLVHTLVRQLGGELHVQGESGTQVSVLFPRTCTKRAAS